MGKNKKYLIILLIVFLALTLRLIKLGGFEVAGDEGNYALRVLSTTMTTPWNWYLDQNLPFWTQLSFFDHPPLHFATIWLSCHLFGVNLWAVRLPAVIFGTLSVLLIMLISSRLGWNKEALWSGLSLAILPWHILISRQAQQESLLIFLIFLIIYLLLNINDKKLYYWILTGIVIGLAILTKYLAIIIAPLIIWYFFKERWHKKINFWLLALTTLVVITPIIFYNWQMYQFRGHFDLQFARLINQNISTDWSANAQMIVRDSLTDFESLPLFLIQWLGVGAMLVIIIGSINGLVKRPDFFKKNLFLTHGLLIIVAIIACLTLLDSVHASIMIPFLILSFAVSLKFCLLNLKLI